MAKVSPEPNDTTARQADDIRGEDDADNRKGPYDKRDSLTGVLPVPACFNSPKPVTVLCPICQRQNTTRVVEHVRWPGGGGEPSTLYLFVMATCCCCLIPLMKQPVLVNVHSCSECGLELGRHTGPTTNPSSGSGKRRTKRR